MYYKCQNFQWLWVVYTKAPDSRSDEFEPYSFTLHELWLLWYVFGSEIFGTTPIAFKLSDLGSLNAGLTKLHQ